MLKSEKRKQLIQEIESKCREFKMPIEVRTDIHLALQEIQLLSEEIIKNRLKQTIDNTNS